VIIGLVHLSKGFWNRNGAVEFPLSLAAGVTTLERLGPAVAGSLHSGFTNLE
jgi:hypothetical protein